MNRSGRDKAEKTIRRHLIEHHQWSGNKRGPCESRFTPRVQRTERTIIAGKSTRKTPHTPPGDGYIRPECPIPQSDFRKVFLLGIVAFFGGFQMPHEALGNLNLSNPIRGVLDEVSDLISDQLGPNQIGASYAALISFAGNPDISAATYYIDSGPRANATLSVGRFSYRHPFYEEGDDWRPFVQVMIPYEQLVYDLDTNEAPGVADPRWDGVGAALTVGNEFVLSERWTFVPAINLGSFRLKSNAGFRGANSESILDPSFSGRRFDWTAYAWLLGASLWFEHKREFRNFDLGWKSGFTLNHVRSFHTTSDEIRFSSEAVVLNTSLESIHDTPVNLYGFPISLVLSVGGTAFLGPARDALGFSGYTDYGIAFRADIARLGLPVETLQLGGKMIYGPDVIGWSGVFNYNF